MTPSGVSGSPEAGSRTSSRSAFGPGVPGVVVSSTSVVAAKSVPDATPSAAMGGAVGAAPSAGSSPVRAAVNTMISVATTTSARTTRPSGRASVASAGIDRHRFHAPSPIRAVASPTFTARTVT